MVDLRVSGIYKIVNTENGNFYIGSSKYIHRRWHNSHVKNLVENRHSNCHLQNAWNKYGEEAFTFDILEEIETVELLAIREQAWFDTLNRVHPVYNQSKIVQSPRLGIKVSDETRRKLRESHLGQRHTEEAKRKIGLASAARPRRKLTPEECRMMGERNRGRKHTLETRQRMSKAKKGRKMSSGEIEALSKRSMGNRYSAGREWSEESKLKISIATGKQYPAFVHRETEEVILAGNGLNRMCRARNLSPSAMSAVKLGKKPHHKGWVLLQ